MGHEISHILSGHELKQKGSSSEFLRKPSEEKEADMLAVRLLAPAGILWALNLHTAEDIAKWCRIPVRLARQRACRMEELYMRDRFFSSALERKMGMQFMEFVKKNSPEERSNEFCRRCLETKKKKPSGGKR